eukprot:g62331.t1
MIHMQERVKISIPGSVDSGRDATKLNATVNSRSGNREGAVASSGVSRQASSSRAQSSRASPSPPPVPSSSSSYPTPPPVPSDHSLPPVPSSSSSPPPVPASCSTVSTPSAPGTPTLAGNTAPTTPYLNDRNTAPTTPYLNDRSTAPTTPYLAARSGSRPLHTRSLSIPRFEDFEVVPPPMALPQAIYTPVSGRHSLRDAPMPPALTAPTSGNKPSATYKSLPTRNLLPPGALDSSPLIEHQPNPFLQDLQGSGTTSPRPSPATSHSASPNLSPQPSPMGLGPKSKRPGHFRSTVVFLDEPLRLGPLRPPSGDSATAFPPSPTARVGDAAPGAGRASTPGSLSKASSSDAPALSLQGLEDELGRIYELYLAPNSGRQVNVSSSVSKRCLACMQKLEAIDPSDETSRAEAVVQATDAVVKAQTEVYKLLETDTFKRFRNWLTRDKVKELARDPILNNVTPAQSSLPNLHRSNSNRSFSKLSNHSGHSRNHSATRATTRATRATTRTRAPTSPPQSKAKANEADAASPPPVPPSSEPGSSTALPPLSATLSASGKTMLGSASSPASTSPPVSPPSNQLTMLQSATAQLTTSPATSLTRLQSATSQLTSSPPTRLACSNSQLTLDEPGLDDSQVDINRQKPDVQGSSPLSGIREVIRSSSATSFKASPLAKLRRVPGSVSAASVSPVSSLSRLASSSSSATSLVPSSRSPLAGLKKLASADSLSPAKSPLSAGKAPPADGMSPSSRAARSLGEGLRKLASAGALLGSPAKTAHMASPPHSESRELPPLSKSDPVVFPALPSEEETSAEVKFDFLPELAVEPELQGIPERNAKAEGSRSAPSG